MDSGALVEIRDLGNKIQGVVANAKIPIEGAFWEWSDEGGPQFFLVTPEVNAKGALAVYKKIFSALKKEPFYRDIDLHGFTLLGTREPVAISFAKRIKGLPKPFQERPLHVKGEAVDGRYVPEAYIYTRALLIHKVGNGEFAATIAPHAGRPPLPQVQHYRNLEEVQNLLEELRVEKSMIKKAIEDLRSTGNTSLPYTALSVKALRNAQLL